MLRKNRFVEDLMKELAKLPDGSWSHRRVKSSVLRDIADDLAYLGVLPMRLKNLQSEAVIRLTDYWKKLNLKPKTMKNKLGILRKVLSVLEYPVAIPTNKELGIISHATRNMKPVLLRNPIDPHDIPVYPMFVLQEIYVLQYLFGLKVYEAIRVDSSMLNESNIEVPHAISFNKKDRRVPIITHEQKEFVEKFKMMLSSYLPLPKNQYQCFMALYHYSERMLKIKLDDYFRLCYVQNRYRQLSGGHNHFDALEMIRLELGYSRVGQIRGVIPCENSF